MTRTVTEKGFWIVAKEKVSKKPLPLEDEATVAPAVAEEQAAAADAAPAPEAEAEAAPANAAPALSEPPLPRYLVEEEWSGSLNGQILTLHKGTILRHEGYGDAAIQRLLDAGLKVSKQ